MSNLIVKLYELLTFLSLLLLLLDNLLKFLDLLLGEGQLGLELPSQSVYMAIKNFDTCVSKIVKQVIQWFLFVHDLLVAIVNSRMDLMSRCTFKI